MSKEFTENSGYQEQNYRFFGKREGWYGFCSDVEKSGTDPDALERVKETVAKKKLPRIPNPEDGKRWLMLETRTQANRLGDEIAQTLSSRTEIDHVKSFAFPVSKDYFQGWSISNDVPIDEFPQISESTNIYLNANSSPRHQIIIEDTQMAMTVLKKNTLALSMQSYEKEIFSYSLSIDFKKQHPEVIISRESTLTTPLVLTKRYEAKLPDVLAFNQLFQDAKNFRT